MINPQRQFMRIKSDKYSKWHRSPTLPEWCYMTDGDWFEQRLADGQLRSVALIEDIEVPLVDNADKDYAPFPSKRALCREIQAKMGIPAYIVWHTPNCDDFLVLRAGQTNPRRMNEQEYKEFIRTL